MKLYEIDKAITECIDEETGEVIDFERLDNLQIERKKKIESVCLWYRDLMSDVDALKAEVAYLNKRKQRCESKAQQLLSYVASAIGNDDSFETPLVRCKYRKSTSVFISGEIPKKYMRIKYEPDKVLIKNAIKSGIKVRGASLQDNKILVIERGKQEWQE